ncbi:multidrug-efflux transporter, MFS family [Deferribacter desulfuricans SSM1]|uniref:Multidrug-efflux transporter, MFS family n=1 Tax=Deferribacter desulfuricans (strain DSM 14783 / JCM 11476 / NBRC 101012 / SSM1) TaxID=639282 RepID=D3PE25_DEFDS|nr:MFS transporter [Deferribacter desulfuricans]BAI80848.1 multidrug-efflux transporter, MFS family [Deferribacter desulfuricans SSM1]
MQKIGFSKESLKMYIFLLLLTLAAYSGLQGWRTLFNNFAVEVANLNGFQIGIIQSVREIPGFLALLVIYLLFIFSEHRLASISIIILGIGIALTGFLPTFYGVILTTLIMSFGFHYYETLNQSLTLQYFSTSESPLVFAKLRSIAALTNIFIGIILFFVAKYFSYKNLFLTIGVFIIFLGSITLFIDPSRKDLPVQRKKMIFRKKYWLFYTLTLFAGARRQIFVAFSVFLLVKKFHFSVVEISALFVINNLINYFLNPLIGKAINKFGERKVLSLEYFSLIFIFITYAYSNSKIIVGLMYILDHIFFNFAIAIRTFFQKIADPKDIAPSMAVGFTINHIAAVIFPVIGGILWSISYKISFLMGAFLSLTTLIFAQFIDYEIKKHQSN